MPEQDTILPGDLDPKKVVKTLLGSIFERDMKLSSSRHISTGLGKTLEDLRNNRNEVKDEK